MSPPISVRLLALLVAVAVDARRGDCQVPSAEGEAGECRELEVEQLEEQEANALKTSMLQTKKNHVDEAQHRKPNPKAAAAAAAHPKPAAPSAAQPNPAAAAATHSQWSTIQVDGGVDSNRVYLSSTPDGSNVDLHDVDEGSGRQRWSLKKGGGSGSSTWYNIVVLGGVSDGRVYLSSTPDGSNVDLHDVDEGSGRQRWTLTKGFGDWYLIKVLGGVDGTRRYLSSTPDGSTVDLHDSDEGSGRQHWKIDFENMLIDLVEEAQHSGLHKQDRYVPGEYYPGPHQYNPGHYSPGHNNNPGQHLTVDPSAVYLIENVNSEDKFLNVRRESTSNGADVWMWTDPLMRASQWRLKEISYGVFTIESARAPGKFLNGGGGSTARGANVMLWDNPYALEAQWLVSSVSYGVYTFENMRARGLYLNVQGESRMSGASVILWDNPHSAASQWRLEEYLDAPLPGTGGNYGYYDFYDYYYDILWLEAKDSSAHVHADAMGH